MRYWVRQFPGDERWAIVDAIGILAYRATQEGAAREAARLNALGPAGVLAEQREPR